MIEAIKELWRSLRGKPVRTPFDDGYDAFGAGVPLTANPYQQHSGARGDWHRGWLQAYETWCVR